MDYEPPVTRLLDITLPPETIRELDDVLTTSMGVNLSLLAERDPMMAHKLLIGVVSQIFLDEDGGVSPEIVHNGCTISEEDDGHFAYEGAAKNALREIDYLVDPDIQEFDVVVRSFKRRSIRNLFSRDMPSEEVVRFRITPPGLSF